MSVTVTSLCDFSKGHHFDQIWSGFLENVQFGQVPPY